jgi:hypothetical protein
MASPRSSDQWPAFRSELLDQLAGVELTSTSANKFDALASWLSEQWDLEKGSVVCKYVQHPKNRWNRLREALRRAPSAILLLFDGDDDGAVVQRVSEAVPLCPALDLVVVLTRPADGGWRCSRVLYRPSASIPPVLRISKAEFHLAEFSVGEPKPVPDRGRRSASESTISLPEALERLGLVGDDPMSQLRTDAADALGALTGLQTDDIVFKVIPSTKNLGNRLGEALGLTPALLVVVCPELLEESVIEGIDLWPESARAPLVLILQGEQTRIRIHGPDGSLTDLLRAAVDSKPDEVALPSVEDPPGPPGASVGAVARGSTWAEWSYSDWNDRLVEYSLRELEAGSTPVERIAATPDELVLVARASIEEAAAVAKSFVTACVENLPSGVSLCGFCTDRTGRRMSSNRGWTPASSESPPFFGMLWLTCLVAYGYPDAVSGLHDRLKRLLGKSGFPRCLPSVWEEARQWTLERRGAGDRVRELVLPPPDHIRTIVGASHFLAFPHEHDRRLIARILTEAELVGFEPPILPVVAALQAGASRFSRWFREDLTNFVEKFLDEPGDPRESAFWRAVRQEALDPSYSGKPSRQRRSLTGVLAVFDDEGLLPLLGASADWLPPNGYSVQPLDHAIGGFEHYALAEGGLKETAEVVLESRAMLGPGPRALINQGVLVFQEDQSNEFMLVSGADISGSDTALVRQDLVEPFVSAFGGRPDQSRFAAWFEISACKVRPLDSLPEELSSVFQLARTMSPPTVRLVGGIRVPGGYLGFQGFLPRARAVDAIRVRAIVDSVEYECQPLADAEWALPPEIVGEAPCDIQVEATWKLGSAGRRMSRRTMHLQDATIEDSYRPLRSGHYFLESCCPGQSQAEGGEALPTGVTTSDPSGTYDLLECEPSARFLGSGLGEMSLDPRDDFEWLAVGPKSQPEMMVFVGDPESPKPPENRRSPRAGDRRHWRAAFTNPRSTYVRRADGTYQSVADFPEVATAKHALGKHQPTESAGASAETDLPTIEAAPPSRTPPSDAALAMADAVAGLSARRGGLRYRTVQQLFGELTGSNDYLLHQELIRAWTECGALDLVRSQRYSATTLVARRPRFVAVARGPTVEATLMGLVTRMRARLVVRSAAKLGLALNEVHAGCPWQPPLLRVRGELGMLEELGRVAELEPLEWLAWNKAGEMPEKLRADLDSQQLLSDTPPEGFTTAKYWRWDTSEFRRDRPPGGEVSVEQRVHRDSCSIYVVLVGGEPWLWTYIRNWALLYAYEISSRAPFKLNRRGWVVTSGRSPVHLPLPLGRLNAVLGEGAPGPILDGSQRVEGYCYAFGRRVTHLAEQVIPSSWLEEETS